MSAAGSLKLFVPLHFRFKLKALFLCILPASTSSLVNMISSTFVTLSALLSLRLIVAAPGCTVKKQASQQQPVALAESASSASTKPVDGVNALYGNGRPNWGSQGDHNGWRQGHRQSSRSVAVAQEQARTTTTTPAGTTTAAEIAAQVRPVANTQASKEIQRTTQNAAPSPTNQPAAQKSDPPSARPSQSPQNNPSGSKRGLAWALDDKFAGQLGKGLISWYMHWANPAVPFVLTLDCSTLADHVCAEACHKACPLCQSCGQETMLALQASIPP